MKSIFISIFIILVGISIIKTFQIGDPIIYKDIEQDKGIILDSIDILKNANRIERVISLSDSIIAISVRNLFPKIQDTRNAYYKLIDFCIEYYQKDRMLSSMTLQERYDFKQNKVSWNILASAATPLGSRSGPYVSQGYRLNELNRVEQALGE